jgi:3-oxoacyl-[acyl-carrier-protein] synthase III
MTELHVAETQRYSKIYSLGASRGNLAVSNDEIAGPIDSSDEWIRQRTGVITRARATDDQTLAYMAVEAGKEAITKAGIKPEQIDLVIVSTISFPYATPSAATLIAAELGIPDAAAYDISAACAGYCYGIAQADSMIRSGLSEYALVIGAEDSQISLTPLIGP